MPTIQCELAAGLEWLGRPGDVCTALEILLNSEVSLADKADAEKRLEDLKR